MWLVIGWSGVGLLVAASVAQRDVPTASLYLDPAATSSARVWTGFFTELGLMLWVVAATAAAFLWAANSRGPAGDRSEARLGMSAALLTAMLWLDDQFAVRNWLLPRVLGAPDSAGKVIYLTLGVAWVSWNWRAILRADTTIVAAAALGLGFSEAVDLALAEQYTSGRTILEEAPKLLGIVAWALFFLLRLSQTLCRTVEHAPAPPPEQVAQRGTGPRVRP